jgi:hypothetical protein
MKGLVLHVNATECSRDDLWKVELPPKTSTHVPIGHDVLVNEVIRQLEFHGHKLKSEAHGLTGDGQRYFGVIELESGGSGYSNIVGLRNSHDKAFSASVAGGGGVFVCDNLSFCGNIKMNRKHTAHILRDMGQFVGRAVGRLGGMYKQQAIEIDSFKSCELEEDRARSLMIEAFKRGVYPASTLPKVLEQWEKPEHEEFEPRTVWSLFNAVTAVGKDWAPDTLRRRTQLMHGMFRGEAAGHQLQLEAEPLAV